MRVHTTCNVCIRNTSRMSTCHTQHWIDITLNCPSEQNGLTNNWQCFCITTQYSKYNQSQLYFILLENFNLYHLTGIHNYQKSNKVCTTSFFWITLLALFWTLLVWKHHPSPWLSNILFERLFLPEKVTNYKTSTVFSHKHEFLTVIITTEHVAVPNNIQHFL